ncbi:MAG: tetratricopeptide repeat protein [Desulfovibrionales bacterium]|nr:tetratricopeptide repeat protein [Desulfovibrionales bacterium]
MRIRNKHLRFVILSGCALSLLVGCAAQTPSRLDTTQTPLNPEAATTYNYLVFEEAARKNDYALAESSLDKLLALTPPMDVYVEASNFYLQNNHASKARQIADQALATYPENFRMTLLKAESYRKEKDTNNATAVIAEYLAAHPESDDAHRALGLLYFDNGQFPEAVDAFRQSPEEQRAPITRIFLAKALIQLNKYADAEEELLKATEQEENLLEAWSELARLYELQKNYILAEQAYEQLITIENSNEISWLRLINLNLKLNNPTKARELVQIGPASSEFIIEAARLFITEGFFNDAKELLQPYAEAKEPVEIFFHLALIAFEYEKDMNKALQLLDNIPEENVAWTNSLEFRTRLLFELGRIEEAVRLITTAQTNDPNNRFLVNLRIELLTAAKKYPEALDATETALLIWPEDRELLFTMGSLYHSLGNKNRALEIMEEIISLDPQHYKALNFVGYTLAETGQDIDRALVLVRTAATLAPDEAYILDSLAWIYFIRQDYKNAWTYITQAVNLGTNDPTIWEHYGDIASKQGNTAEAHRGYEKALKTHPSPEILTKKLKEL